MPVLVSLLPVFAFLALLIAIDSYKLIALRAVLLTIAAGCGTAGASFLINRKLLGAAAISPEVLVRYVGPLIEEALKSIPVFYLIRSRRIGFMVDAAIYGFAVGAGFSFIENLYYLRALGDQNILLWIVRGLGTAVMHGGTTAILGVVAKTASDRFPSRPLATVLMPVALAAVIHSAFNHFFLPAVLETIMLLLALPLILVLVFRRSEESTRTWLGVGLDADMDLLHMMTTGDLSESNIGKYIRSLRERFPPAVIADMMCLLRLQTELALRSKGILMMREAGFTSGPDPEITAKFEELEFLEKSIGATGKMALRPVMHAGNRELWQMRLLRQ